VRRRALLTDLDRAAVELARVELPERAEADAVLAEVEQAQRLAPIRRDRGAHLSAQ
jgi:hypothetical protein